MDGFKDAPPSSTGAPNTRELPLFGRILDDANLERIADFTLRHLTLTETAEWLAIDYLYERTDGPITDGDRNIPDVIELHWAFEQRLSKAVEDGSLNVASLRRNADGSPNPDSTLISWSSLQIYLGTLGWRPGNVFSGWVELKDFLTNLRCERDFLQIQLRLQNPNGRTMTERRRPRSEAILAQVSDPKPVEKRERKTFLSMIWALMDIARMDRGAVQKISKRTEVLGVPVSEDTVLNKLHELDLLRADLDQH